VKRDGGSLTPVDLPPFTLVRRPASPLHFRSADATAVDVWTSRTLTDRRCAWRHAKDLKTAEGMREFAGSRAARPFRSPGTCRCNCPWDDSYEAEAEMMKKSE